MRKCSKEKDLLRDMASLHQTWLCSEEGESLLESDLLDAAEYKADWPAFHAALRLADGCDTIMSYPGEYDPRIVTLRIPSFLTTTVPETFSEHVKYVTALKRYFKNPSSTALLRREEGDVFNVLPQALVNYSRQNKEAGQKYAHMFSTAYRNENYKIYPLCQTRSQVVHGAAMVTVSLAIYCDIAPSEKTLLQFSTSSREPLFKHCLAYHKQEDKINISDYSMVSDDSIVSDDSRVSDYSRVSDDSTATAIALRNPKKEAKESKKATRKKTPGPPALLGEVDEDDFATAIAIRSPTKKDKKSKKASSRKSPGLPALLAGEVDGDDVATAIAIRSPKKEAKKSKKVSRKKSPGPPALLGKVDGDDFATAIAIKSPKKEAKESKKVSRKKSPGPPALLAGGVDGGEFPTAAESSQEKNKKSSTLSDKVKQLIQQVDDMDAARLAGKPSRRKNKMSKMLSKKIKQLTKQVDDTDAARLAGNTNAV